MFDGGEKPPPTTKRKRAEVEPDVPLQADKPPDEPIPDKPANKSFECIQCKKFYETAAKKKHHDYYVHRNHPICPLCHKTFTNQQVLDIHHRGVHLQEAPHICFCGATFTQPGNLKKHENDVHLQLKPQVCHCGATFSQLRSLQVHERGVHLKLKPHVCDCGADFAQLQAFEEHTNTHTGARPYVCDQCPKAFAFSDSLRSHLLVHKESWPYPCMGFDCEAKFRTLSGHRLHVLRDHTDKQSPEYLEWAARIECNVHPPAMESPEEAYRKKRESINARRRVRYSTDDVYRLIDNLRSRTRSFFSDCKVNKSDKTSKLLGCTFEELIIFLNKNDRGLKYGDPGLHIDHIRCLASFKKTIHCAVEQLKACNFNNLQLLPKGDNMRKSDEYDAEAYAESEAGMAIADLEELWKMDGVCGCELCKE